MRPERNLKSISQLSVKVGEIGLRAQERADNELWQSG
jgi:hypothetical protein